MGSFLLSGSPVGVPSADGAFGSWVLAYTPSVPLFGFYVCFQNINAGGEPGLFNIGVGSSQYVIAEQLYAAGTSMSYRVPIFIPAGTPIYLQAATYAGTYTYQCSIIGQGGKSQDRLIRKINVCENPLSLAYFQTTYPASATTQITTSAVPHPIKGIIVGSNANTAQTLGMSAGPSTTADLVIAQNLLLFNDQYYFQLTELAVDLPPGLNLFLVNQGTNAGQGNCYYYT